MTANATGSANLSVAIVSSVVDEAPAPALELQLDDDDAIICST
jgi:hypothetical protein